MRQLSSQKYGHSWLVFATTDHPGEVSGLRVVGRVSPSNLRGNVATDDMRGDNYQWKDTRDLGAVHRLPTGHPGRAGAGQQLMSGTQPAPLIL